MPKNIESSEYNEIVLSGKQRLQELVSRCIRIKTLSPTMLCASTFRVKINGKGTSVVQWREVHKHQLDPRYFDKERYPDTAGILGELTEELTLKLLHNRKYFNTCRCCGHLNHLDEMNNRLCESCSKQSTSKDDWVESKLIQQYIKLQDSPVSLELEKLRFNDESPESFEYLEVPAFLRKTRPVLSGAEKEAFQKKLQAELDAGLVEESVEESQNDKVYGILYCTWDWVHPHESVSTWKQVAHFDSPLNSEDTELVQNEIQKVLSNRRYFQTCEYCGELHHRNHMSGRTCNTCRHPVRSVVY